MMNKIMKNSFNIAIIALIVFSCGKVSAAEPKECESPVDSPKERIVKVMTYNIHIGNPPSKPADFRDLEAIARVINTNKPDLVALQEVDNKTKRSGVSVNQAQELAKLTGMHVFFAKAMDYQGGEYGDAILSRLPILEKTRYDLPVEGTGSRFEPRSVALIKVEKRGKEFLFASTHLDHLEDESNRILQANELNKIIEDLKLPLILAGDLNAQPQSETIGILGKKLTNACQSNCPNTFPQDKPDRILDYIMFKKKDEFEVKSFRVINETYASDHLPLIAELKIN